MKKCIVCDIELNKDNQNDYAKNNYIHKCKDCLRNEKKIFARSVPKEKKNEISKRCNTRRKENNPKKHSAINMSSSSKKRAEKKGVDHNIDTNFILSIMPDYCPVFNVKLKYGPGGKDKYSASLDRIDSTKGYTKDNVQILSMLANLMKSNANEEELRIFCRWVDSNNQMNSKYGTIK